MCLCCRVVKSSREEEWQQPWRGRAGHSSASPFGSCESWWSIVAMRPWNSLTANMVVSWRCARNSRLHLQMVLNAFVSQAEIVLLKCSDYKALLNMGHTASVLAWIIYLKKQHDKSNKAPPPPPNPLPPLEKKKRADWNRMILLTHGGISLRKHLSTLSEMFR